MIFPQGSVAAGFNGQRTVGTFPVQPDRFINHIPVTALEAVVFPALPADKETEAGRCDRVRHDHLAGILLQQDGADQRDQAVPVDFFSVGVHNRSPVAVGIKDYTEISAGAEYGRTE